MRTFKALPLLLAGFLLGLFALSGCSSPDNDTAHFGTSAACHRAGLLNQDAAHKGIYVPDEVKVTAQYHCDHGIKAADQVAPNKSYPEGISPNVCVDTTATPASNGTHRESEAKCVSAWADFVVFALNSPEACIKPLNDWVQRVPGAAKFPVLMATCDPSSDGPQLSTGNLVCVVIVIVVVVVLLLFTSGGGGGGGLSQEYMRNRS